MEYIEHHGIKGQKWGVRRYQNANGSLTDTGRKHYGVGNSAANGQVPEELVSIPKATRKSAKKDAKEFAEAKMYYGEGAGIRRRRIKQIVEQKSKDADYKKAFDYYYNNIDMAKTAAKTKRVRKTKDAVKNTTETTLGIANMYLGNVAKASAAAAIAYYAMHQSGIDKVIMDYAKLTLSQLKH